LEVAQLTARSPEQLAITIMGTIFAPSPWQNLEISQKISREIEAQLLFAHTDAARLPNSSL
jgi:hypothetical protein